MKKLLIAAISGILGLSMAAVVKTAPQFGGTTVVTPATIRSYPLYNTPTGNIDKGFYYVNAKGDSIAHMGDTLVGTTTRPNGLYAVTDTTGLTLATQTGLQYVFYDASGKVIGTSTDPTIGTQIHTKDAPMPTITI